MEIRNLQTFVMAASLLNFTQTARELGYSQSNISMQIQQLEEEVGAKLFDRIGRSVSLTQQGQDLLPYAQQIVSLSEQMGNALKEDEELAGSIRIGLCQSVFDVFFETGFSVFHERFPKVRVDAVVDNTANLLSMLQKNVIDAACLIDRQLPQNDWKIHAEFPVRIGIVVNPSHRLACLQEISAEDLREESFVLMEESAPYNLMLYPMFHDINIEDRIKLRLENCGMAARLIAACDSVTLLPEYAVREMAAEGQVRFIPLKDYEQLMHVQILTHRNKVLTPQITGFADTFAEILDTSHKKHGTVQLA
ncbi:MAG: LysR family transcriptional regulator [Lachnospiraceae bacterium]|nr:LysR family transcriptional regulator [Lachnospiraceae bacterium]